MKKVGKKRSSGLKPLNRYLCPQCGRVVKREDNSVLRSSFCTKTGQDVELRRLPVDRH